jgi:hypothetical protein
LFRQHQYHLSPSFSSHQQLQYIISHSPNNPFPTNSTQITQRRCNTPSFASPASPPASSASQTLQWAPRAILTVGSPDPRQRDSQLTRNHLTDDAIGKTCTFKDYDSFLNVAGLYCYQFKNEFSIPKGSDGSIKIGQVPDGYGGQQIFWGECVTRVMDSFVDG